MMSLLKRTFKLLIGFLLIAAVIWVAGPFLNISGWQPLASESARLGAIASIVVLWLAWVLVERWQAKRASSKLAAAVISQSHAAEPAPPADVLRLREGFEQAIATLTTRGRGSSLYDLPWYVFMGAPGSGKTTALLNSGLNFSLEQSGGQARLRGIGGTRNCDWWFTDEAVFLDTAGRFTTQDSDAASDSAGWKEFLALLGTHRKRRPINGVILTVSVKDLLTHGDVVRDQQVEAARYRLRELGHELNIQLPVYVMVTMCDLAAGFTEYFDDLGQEARAQVWGVTFPYEQSLAGDAARSFAAEFDALVTRLNERLFARLEDESDPRRRARIFAFPQQIAALRDALAQFVTDVFASTTFDHQILLRGVYLTSGTQEGTPIDRLLGAIGRGFRVAPEAVAAPLGRGKAYFVERLLKQVLIGESGLAGVNRRFEVQKAIAQLGAYAAMAFVAAVGVMLLSVSYNRNRAYVQDVEGDVETLRAVPAVREVTSADRLVPRLDAVRAVADSANRYDAEGAPWRMRWGLYQGRSIGNAAREAYLRELDSSLLPFVAERMQQRMLDYRAEPDKLYEYLKAYLMLNQPEHLEPSHLQYLAHVEWSQQSGVSAEAGASLSRHFQRLIDRGDLRPVSLNTTLVSQACATIERVSLAKIMYGWLKDTYAANDTHQVRLDVAGGVGAQAVIRRKSGVPLSEPMSGLYSRTVFEDINGKALPTLVDQFAQDNWVCEKRDIGNRATLETDLRRIYQQEYIAAWDAIVNDLEIVAPSTVKETADVLGVLGGPTSPLRFLLQVVRDNTLLYDRPASSASSEAPEQPGVLERATERLKSIIPSSPGAPAVQGATPGAVVTARFHHIHRLFDGEPGNAPIDALQSRLRALEQQYRDLGSQVGGGDVVKAANDPAVRQAREAVEQEAAVLPPVIQSLIFPVVRRADVNLTNDAAATLVARYRQQVLSECQQLLTGRYPFTRDSASDVPLSDFGRLFGSGGVFDGFFDTELAPLVDTSTRPWRWRPGAVSWPREMLARFEAAQAIRQTFFGSSQQPALSFSVTIADVDEDATRFVLRVDGQDFERPRERLAATWPGPTQGVAEAAFQDRTNIPSGARFEGPWALFRLIDYAEPRHESQTRTTLTLRGRQNSQDPTNRRYARIVLEADSLSNPFVRQEWRDFRCGS